MKNKLVKALDEAEETIEHIEKEVQAVIEPVQKSVFKRFPILFTLLVTFGVAATFLGFEHMLLDVSFLNERPWLMLSIGLGILAVTGTLYKKLG